MRQLRYLYIFIDATVYFQIRAMHAVVHAVFGIEQKNAVFCHLARLDLEEFL